MKTSLAVMTFLLLVILPFTSALIIPKTTDANIKIYNLTQINSANFSAGIPFRIEFKDSEFDNLKNYTFTVKKNTTFSSNTGFVIEFLTNDSESTYKKLYEDANSKITNCLIQRGQFETQWNICQGKLLNYEGVNATQCKDNLSACQLSIQAKDLIIQAKDSEIADVKTQSDDSKNTKWFYGIIGLAIGAVGLHWYRSSKGGGTVRERSRGEFNPGQAG